MSLLRRILQRVLGVRPRSDDYTPPPADYTREDMDAALKAIVVPHLRAMGFKGTMPHFRRERGEAVDLLGFMFNRYGGKFVVELGRMPPGGVMVQGKLVPPAKAKVFYLKERHRLGSELRINYGDHWFAFANRDPEAVARDVCTELDRAEAWELVDRMALTGEW